VNDDQLIRYSRHILLPEIGIEGQEKLRRSHALIIGAGGLGSPAALYLAASGVGRLTICDGDAADLTNLQRQIVHRVESIGVNKALSARRTLASINAEVEVVAVPERLQGEALQRRVAEADVVLDCCDNFATRHAVNRACVAQRKPLVSGAGVRFDGQVAVFDMRDAASPCYNCLFSEDAEFEETRCAVMGVFAPLVGIIGSTQAAEALKILTGAGDTLNGRLLMLDALSMEWHRVKLNRDPLCKVCGVRQDADQQPTTAFVA
jgi:molybdopterin-synthase adenylyltransferase